MEGFGVKEVILTPQGHERLKEEIEHPLPSSGARWPSASSRRASSATSQRTPSTTTPRTSRRCSSTDRHARGEAEERARDREARVTTDVVSVGTIVRLRDVDAKETIEYAIVGSAEANPAENKLSNESPVGKAILGKKKGETVEVAAPRGSLKYKIMDIRRSASACAADAPNGHQTAARWIYRSASPTGTTSRPCVPRRRPLAPGEEGAESRRLAGRVLADADTGSSRLSRPGRPLGQIQPCAADRTGQVDLDLGDVIGVVGKARRPGVVSRRWPSTSLSSWPRPPSPCRTPTTAWWTRRPATGSATSTCSSTRTRAGTSRFVAQSSPRSAATSTPPASSRSRRRRCSPATAARSPSLS